MRLLPLVFLLACDGDDGVDDTGSVDVEDDGVEVRTTGAAAWDPFLTVHEPAITRVDGRPVTVRPLQDPGTGHIYGWAPDEEVGPGTLLIDGESHEVDEYGRSEAFTLADVDGKVYRWSEDGSFGTPPGMEGLVTPYLGQAWFEVLETDAEADEITFRVLSDLEDYPLCEVFRSHASITPTGEVWLEHDALDLRAAQDLSLHDGRLHFGFSGDGDRIGGIEIFGTTDTRVWSEALFEGDDVVVCDLFATFGVQCFACEGPDSLCMAVREHGATAVLDPDPPDLQDVPLCGIDLTDAPTVGPLDIEPIEISCDFDPDFDLEVDGCGCSSAHRQLFLSPLLALLIAVSRRRS